MSGPAEDDQHALFAAIVRSHLADVTELAAEKAELELAIGELRERAELIDQVSQLVSGNATSIDKARNRRVS